LKYDGYRAQYERVEPPEPKDTKKKDIKNKLPPMEKKPTIEDDDAKIAALERELL
jgi:hypothetical protein